MRVPSKHIKTLNRRLQYLEGLKKSKEANSFDLAEISALRDAINFIEEYNPAPPYVAPTLTRMEHFNED